MLLISKRRRITQHKIFVPYGTQQNFYFAKTSFKLGTLYEIGRPRTKEIFIKMSLAKLNIKERKNYD
ncbi:hypothetical protein D9V84_09425 [Bacteroidetes/Chlorobi group bacterium Naka2016]|nr:MAG: hypothetical protein D9V84_09425 [Bacteroidetes/Chlorobi group bacterium Naka2016]